MLERFGPWSSALDDGLSPRLSTFWKRRLALLASARAARAGLSRRDWLKLGAAGAATCALPTLHLASADGPDDVKPVAAGKIYVHATFPMGGGGKGSNTGLFAIDPATSTCDKVLDSQGGTSLSPDGRTLAMSRSGWTGPDFREIDNPGVWIIGADGKGEMRRIADFGGKISWSPDSKQLIVAKGLSKPKDDDMRCENWRLNVDGSGATKLLIPETEEVDGWSPDGRWFVTVSDRHPPHGRGYQLYLMRPDGSEQRRLTEGGGLNVYPRFSPDGRRIAYLHQEHGQDSIWIINIDGRGRRRVLQEENDLAPESCCWSPDGKALACTVMQWERDEKNTKVLGLRGVGNPQIVIVDVEGKSKRTLDLPQAMWMGAPDWR
jgi:Tol biopolymer transport system component